MAFPESHHPIRVMAFQALVGPEGQIHSKGGLEAVQGWKAIPAALRLLRTVELHTGYRHAPWNPAFDNHFPVDDSQWSRMLENHMADQSSSARRPRGNPAMRRGAPSVNPHGRPPIGRTLANAIRQRISPHAIVTIALRIVESESAPANVRLRALELLARRGYGAIAGLGQLMPQDPADSLPAATRDAA